MGPSGIGKSSLLRRGTTGLFSVPSLCCRVLGQLWPLFRTPGSGLDELISMPERNGLLVVLGLARTMRAF